jgi:RHS repeat-associated protein
MIPAPVSCLLSFVAVFLLSLGAAGQNCSMTGPWVGSYWGDASGGVSASFTQSGTSLNGTVNGYSVQGTNTGTQVSLGPKTVNHVTATASGTFSANCATLSGGWGAVNTLKGKTTTGSFSISANPVTPQENPGQGNPSEPQLCRSCGSAGDPINTAFGTFSERFQDFSVPGRGMALMLGHTYNSVFAAINGPLGYGWTHSYAIKLVQSTSGVVTVIQENGSQVSFLPFGGEYTAPPRVIATLVKNTDGTFLFTRRAQQFFTFSSTGQLLSEHDRNGYTTVLAYDGLGQLATVTDPAGRILTFTYSGSHLTSVTDPLGRRVEFAYDTNGNLSTVTDVAGGQTTFTYSTNHLLLKITDPGKGVVTNNYNSANRVISQTDQLGRKTLFSYGSGTTTITDPKGNVTQEQYDQLKERIALTRGFGTTSAATWHFTYDPAIAAITSVTDPNGHTSTMTYDAFGNLLKRADALGRVTTQTWDAMNDLTSVTDPLGVITTLTYDANGNLLTRSRPLTGSSSVQNYTYQYSDSTHPGDVTGIVDPDGKTSKYTYDTDGNPITATDPLGHTTKFSYNVIGLLTSLTDARGKITTYAYDLFGDPTVTTDPLGHKVARTYDGNRNLTSITDANGNVTSFTYDAANERTKTTRADGTILQTVYNLDGTVAKTVNGAGNATTYGYDPLARPITITDPLSRTTTYKYDGASNLLTLTDSAGQITTKSYDAANELVDISYSDGKTPKVTMAYDADGQRISMIDGTGTSSWTYDSLHRIKAITTGAGAEVAYMYDLKGQLTALTYPGGIHKVGRSYDSAGRLTAITDWLGNKTTFAYDSDGNLTTEIFPATTGITAKFAYDGASRLTSILYTKGATTLASFAYVRDAAGLLSGVNETGVPVSGVDTYGYTKLNQLKNVNSSVYSYDAADDVTGLILPPRVLKYDTADELSTLTAGTQTTTLTYDSRGNRLSRTPPSGSKLTYGYDQANRMVAFGTTATYVYDGDGLRMHKTVGSKPEAFTWDRSGSIPLLISDGSTSYVYGPGGVPLEQVSSSGTALFYLHDQQGSTRIIVNSSGTAQGGYTYDAYGNVLATSGSVANPFGYDGQFADSESGLIYLRARYYDPGTAQFLGTDPARADTNLYAYVHENPLNLVDPQGLEGSYYDQELPVPVPLVAGLKYTETLAAIMVGSAYGAVKVYQCVEDPWDTLEDVIKSSTQEQLSDDSALAPVPGPVPSPDLTLNSVLP